MPEFNLAQAVGMVSFILGILCFYQRNDRRLRIMMLAMNINHALHYALLGTLTSCISALLAALRTGVSIKTRSRSVGALLIGVSLLLGLYFTEHWYDLFAVAGTCIGTYALYWLSGIKMRLAFLVGASCWFTNNIIVGSIGGTLMEVSLLTMNSITILRLYYANKRKLSESSAS